MSPNVLSAGGQALFINAKVFIDNALKVIINYSTAFIYKWRKRLFIMPGI
jgi:hypothetical protein